MITTRKSSGPGGEDRQMQAGAKQCNEEPKPGDLIEIFHLGYEHWAIYVGDGYVIHLDPIGDFPRNSSSSVLSVLNSRAEVKRERLEDVVAGCRYRINNHLDHKYKPQSVDKIISSAKEKVGQQMPYNVLNKNCEHFVTDLRYGQPRSLQPQTPFLD
ncbi:PREDICTED: retinoic acid receptor responder protein 3 [Elephantulus edwardii]|uniref:retinoic acid receptor responder protein 3 n=1 Tax=Elephantulus edwardii TaxID=28737 RepID=UPI0003F0E1FF|nr:PREDICTED: retinoic acid receptor responder protein 3 [Elephantulus edwardii]